MSDERPFITVQHPINRRWAILEDDGVGAWLYITEPEETAPVADCYVYSVVPPVAAIPKDWDRGTPPPLTIDYATERAHQPDAASARIRIGWEKTGKAAIVMIDDEPVAMLVVGESRGCSKSISRSGPYGEPWDEKRFEKIFAEHFS